jgi:hypothetical protein
MCQVVPEDVRSPLAVSYLCCAYERKFTVELKLCQQKKGAIRYLSNHALCGDLSLIPKSTQGSPFVIFSFPGLLLSLYRGTI